MKTFKTRFVEVSSYLFILLFFYASISKIIDFENFQVQIAQSPILSAYAGIISYLVIIIEIVICLLLVLPVTRVIGLYASTALMSAFTVYIYLILNYSDFIPCSCGGILEKMSWTQHLVFNIVCVMLGIISVIIAEKQRAVTSKSLIVWLLVTNILSCLTILSLFFSSEHIIKKENNFTRRFLIHPIIKEKSMDLKVNSYYFAGEDHNKIYLGSYTSPFTLTTIDMRLNQFEQMQLIPPKNQPPLQSTKIVVKYPYAYLADGRVPVIYRAHFGKSSLSLYSYKDVFFSDYTVSDTTGVSFRAKNASGDQYIGGQLKKNFNAAVKINQNAFLNAEEGIFSNDGKLIDTGNGKVVFVYYYRNMFSISQPDFTDVRTYNTIDTISVAKLTIVKLKNGHKKMAAPPLMVNKNATAYGNVLFNQSNVKGKYESHDLWQSNSVIDMYRTDRQEYLGSFYINNLGKSRVSQLMATEKYFYTITENEIVRYRYAQSVSKHFHTGTAENLQKE